jgi:hypothetical protein
MARARPAIKKATIIPFESGSPIAFLCSLKLMPKRITAKGLILIVVTAAGVTAVAWVLQHFYYTVCC